jgi:cephalosporin hydroxylase
VIQKIVRAAKEPQILRNFIDWHMLGVRVALHNAFVKRFAPEADGARSLPELQQIRERARLDTDISDHLPMLFGEALSVHPALIVELGVRGGDSTFVLERVAKLAHARLISVDIVDCSDVTAWLEWLFVQSDDIAFSRQFTDYCARHGIRNPRIDVLFIDSSHQYAHTVQELECWFPFLAPHAKVMFHDTNQRRLGRRKDGRLMRGMDNRGVIAALENYFQCSFDAGHDFVEVCDDWLITHIAHSNGFTILTKLSLEKSQAQAPQQG